jgi:tetratricopeptide (TPR) repeat protein
MTRKASRRTDAVRKTLYNESEAVDHLTTGPSEQAPMPEPPLPDSTRGPLATSIASLLAQAEIQPENAELQCALGHGLLLAGDFVRARERLERALAIRPGYSDAAINLADLMLQSGDANGAAARYEQILRADPDCFAAWHNLGRTLEQLGRFAEGAEAFRIAIKLRTDEPGSYEGMARCLLAAGLAVNAVRALRHAVSLRPNSAHAWDLLGKALDQLGETEAASECRARLRKLNEVEEQPERE